MYLNSFDLSILHFLNKFSNVSPRFDMMINWINDFDLLKGGIFMSSIWLFWFTNADEKEVSRVREEIVSNLFACFLSVVLARILALSLHFRLRPLHNPELNFKIPYSVDPSTLSAWSSFPSDHAVLFFALATGLYFVSRRAGILGYTYAFLVICLPRLYLGFHYPTDILVGAVIGILVASIAHFIKFRRSIAKPALYFLNKAPTIFYPLYTHISGSYLIWRFPPHRTVPRHRISYDCKSLDSLFNRNDRSCEQPETIGVPALS